MRREYSLVNHRGKRRLLKKRESYNLMQ